MELTKKILSDTTSMATSPFVQDQYRVSNYSYPIDLLSTNAGKNPYGDQYVMFYINITEDSKFTKSDDRGTTIPEVTSRIGGALSGAKLTANQAVTGAMLKAAVSGGLIGSVLGTGTRGAVLGTLGVGGVAATAAKENAARSVGSNIDAGDKQFTKPRKRLQSAIALHVPNNLSINYGVTYGELDTNVFEMISRGGSDVAEALKGATTSPAKNNVGDVLKKNADLIGAAVLAGMGETGKILGKMSTIAVNPKKEQIFEGVPFRTFSYIYDFYPRNEKESENVKNIIDEFKYHMHPELKDTDGFLFVYPAEFDIFYVHAGKENKFIHKHTSAVLESMNVNYAPNGQYNTFANGAPTGVQMTLNFKEVAIITKEVLEATGEVSRKGTTNTTINSTIVDTF
jgi:hypothetical protein